VLQQTHVLACLIRGKNSFYNETPLTKGATMPNPPEHKEFTPRNATKYVVTALVRIKVGQFAKAAITDYTAFEDDDTVVGLTGYLIGWYAGHKLRPVTDAMVDKTADFILAKREELKAKKSEQEQDTPEEN
jgi:hypothetical protein